MFDNIENGRSTHASDGQIDNNPIATLDNS
jgi:hypothetical protein